MGFFENSFIYDLVQKANFLLKHSFLMGVTYVTNVLQIIQQG